MEQAFGDRRLLKMELSRRAGGLTEAAVRYAAEASPPLLIVEDDGAAATGPSLIERLEALAEVCMAGTNLILLGTVNDVGLYRDLTRRGVADYLVVPTQPLRLIEAILDLYHDPARRPAGQVIAFIGAKGGCGSSTIACNTAWRLAERGDGDVVVLDLDLAFGGADLAFNIDTSHGIQSVLSDPERIDDSFLSRLTAKYGERLYLLAAPGVLDLEATPSSLALEATVAALRLQATYVVLDLPRHWSDWVRQCLHTADQVVITAMPDLGSVRNARNLVDFLALRRTLDQPPLLVLNRVGAARRGEVVLKDFGTTVGLAPTLVIAEDAPLFGQAAAVGKMIAEVNSRAKAAEAIRELALRLGAAPAKPKAARPASIPGLLRRLTGRGG